MPERRLLAAILLRVIWDINNNRSLTVTYCERNESIRWTKLWCARDYDRPFTFPWICSHLDLDPKVVRKALIKLAYSKT